MRFGEPDAAESALQDLTEAIRLAPDEPHLYVLRSHVFTLLGRESSARADLEAAARLHGETETPAGGWLESSSRVVAASERADDQSWAGPAQSNPSRRAWWPPARSVDAARTSAQCHLVFAKLGIRHNWRADPLVRAGRPRPALLSKNQALATIDKPARGPGADAGVRPTIYAGGRNWEN